MSVDVVEDVVNFFWDEVHQNLTQMTSHRIAVSNLGTFESRKGKLHGLEGKLKHYLANVPPVTFQRYAITKDVEDRLKRVQGLITMWEEEKQLRKKARERRYGVPTDSVEKQREDPRGNQELGIQEGAR